MIPFIDLKAQYSRIAGRVEGAVLDVMRSGTFILGPVVGQLEERLADFAGTKHCVSCASGTDALVMALMAKGVGPGDAVFTVPFTFMASAEAIATVGATPVFVDIEPGSFNIDPAALERAIAALAAGDPAGHVLPRWPGDRLATLRPRAVIAVDLFGLPADYTAINAIAAKHELFVIEDAAQSFGATAQNKRAGALAEIGCTSFFPAKPLGCFGDGGAIFCDDAELDAVLRSIRVHGQGSDKYENVRMGITGRLDAVQAAVLNVKLDIFEDEIAARQRVAARYDEQIAAAGLPLVTPPIPSGVISAWAQYTVVADDNMARSAHQAKLAAADIPTMIYYPKGLHEQLAFADLGYRRGDFPVSEAMADRVFSLPMHPYLEDAQIDAIVAALAD
jgi:UDP-2-acetamido-2-deoxy-ribo-hexuluronate aminotransferase